MDLKPHDRVTPALQELHWSLVVERIQYKLCLLVHKSFAGYTPVYISDLLTFPHKLHCALRRVATLLCRGNIDEVVTGLSLLPHCEHTTDLKLLQSTDFFNANVTFSFESVYGHQKTD